MYYVPECPDCGYPLDEYKPELYIYTGKEVGLHCHNEECGKLWTMKLTKGVKV